MEHTPASPAGGSGASPLGRVRTVLDSARRFVRHDMWTMEPGAMGRRQRLLVRNIKIVLMLGRYEVYAQVRKSAQALTFNALLALVPLLAFFLTLLKAFGGWDALFIKTIRPLLLSSVAVTDQDVIGGYLDQIAAAVQHGAIGGLTIFLLAYSVIGLLMDTEESINEVWGIKRQRSLFGRFVTYWSLLTIAPVLLLASISLSAWMQHSALFDALAALGVSRLLLLAAPLGASWLAFTLIYKIVPFTKVNVGAAALAGVIAGTLWNAWKFLFTWYAANAVTTANLYGSLAAIPLFIFWLYISWLLLLSGAKLTYAFQHSRTYQPEQERGELSQYQLERLACRLYFELVQRFFSREPPLTTLDLVDRLAVSPRLIEQVIGGLERAGLVEVFGREDVGEILPRLDPSLVTPWELVDTMRRRGMTLGLPLAGEEQARLDEVLAAGVAAERGVLAGQDYRRLAGLHGLQGGAPP